MRNSLDFVKLPIMGRNSGNLAMNSRPSSASGSETSGGEDYTVGEKDGVIIVDHGSRRQESNLMLSNEPFVIREWCFLMVLLGYLDSFLENCR